MVPSTPWDQLSSVAQRAEMNWLAAGCPSPPRRSQELMAKGFCNRFLAGIPRKQIEEEFQERAAKAGLPEAMKKRLFEAIGGVCK